MGSDVDLMAFLRQHGDQQFCRACLAFAFEVSLPAVDSTLAVVGQQTALAEFPGQCAICGRLAVVTGLERRSARPPEDRVLQLVLDQVGRFFCPDCIARRLGLNIGTAQKAVWQLRGSSGVRIDGPACSECGRRGLVVGPGRQKSFAKTVGARAMSLRRSENRVLIHTRKRSSNTSPPPLPRMRSARGAWRVMPVFPLRT